MEKVLHCVPPWLGLADHLGLSDLLPPSIRKGGPAGEGVFPTWNLLGAEGQSGEPAGLSPET